MCRNRVCRSPDVLDRQTLERRVRPEIPGSQRLERLVVIVAPADRLLENGRVRGDAPQPPLLDLLLEPSTPQHVAADVGPAIRSAPGPANGAAAVGLCRPWSLFISVIVSRQSRPGVPPEVDRGAPLSQFSSTPSRAGPACSSPPPVPEPSVGIPSSRRIWLAAFAAVSPSSSKISFAGAEAPKWGDADDGPIADPPIPAHGSGGFDGYSRPDGGWQHRIPVLGVLPLEERPARHAHHPRPHAIRR